MSASKGHVTGVNGNMVNVAFDGQVIKNEVGYISVGGTRLKSEIIRITDGIASMQVYEMTGGIKVGDKVKMGTPLCKVDLEFIKSKGYPLYTPLLITNSDELKSMTGHYGAVTAGETVAVEYVK